MPRNFSETFRSNRALLFHEFDDGSYYSTFSYSISLYCSVPAGKYISNYSHTSYVR